jgi:hypothetical protein
MLALCRKGGDLELFTLPALKRVFRCAGAHRGLPVLEDGIVAPEPEPASAGSSYPQVCVPPSPQPNPRTVICLNAIIERDSGGRALTRPFSHARPIPSTRL